MVLDKIVAAADNAAETLEGLDAPAALEKLGKAVDAVGKYIGAGSTAQKLLDGAIKNNLLKSETMKAISNFPLLKTMRIISVVISAINPPDINPKKLCDSLNTLVGMSQTARASDMQNMARYERARPAQEKTVAFLDAIQAPVQAIRKEFGNSGDPVKEQALRFALANVFVAHNNRIEREELNKVPDFYARLSKILGVPATLDDLFDNGKVPEYKEKYSDFKQRLFEIDSSSSMKQLKQITQDDMIMHHYEVLDAANSDHPNFERFRAEHQADIAEAIEYFKQGNNLQAAMNIVESGAVGVTEDQRGKKERLDIPDKLNV